MRNCVEVVVTAESRNWEKDQGESVVEIEGAKDIAREKKRER
jgi:hypothetical protein